MSKDGCPSSSRTSASAAESVSGLVDPNGVSRAAQARRPRASCWPGEEASSSSYRDAKRGAISAQP
jgi:hypothetical protein